MKKKAYVFDIDGTLADITHRRHHVESKPKNWKAFKEGLSQDTRNEFVCDMYDHLLDIRAYEEDRDTGETPFDILLCSGRGEEQREDTENWLKDKGLGGYTKLYMRGLKDYRADDVIKPELWEQIEEEGYEIVSMFDDRKRVVDKARELGYNVFQVAEGDF
jgi:FMN phosphatase YigB (HAD superfamily)